MKKVTVYFTNNNFYWNVMSENVYFQFCESDLDLYTASENSNFFEETVLVLSESFYNTLTEKDILSLDPKPLPKAICTGKYYLGLFGDGPGDRYLSWLCH